MGLLEIRSARSHAHRHAYTLAEILVVLLIVGVLLALLLPALRGSRAAAKTVRTQTILTQVHAAILRYLGDWREVYPYLAHPAEPWRELRLEGAPTTPSYFAQSVYYANLLVPTYFASRATLDQPGDFGAASRAAEAFMTPYWLTHAAYAAPEFWVGEDAPATLAYFRAVKLHEARFPSRKSLLFHSLSGFLSPEPGDERLWCNAATVDGAVVRRRVTPAFLDHAVSRPYGAMPLPCMATPGGMGGTDFD